MKSCSKIFLIGFLSMVLLSMPFEAHAHKDKKKKKSPYKFETITEVKRTPVKHQYWTGTCWCFSTISFLESELLRNGKEETDLSEMYVVRHTYPHKALDYIRMHGRANHSQGGQSHD
jgi:bleomycin hydrolase